MVDLLCPRPGDWACLHLPGGSRYFHSFFHTARIFFSALPPGPAFLVLGRGTRRACIGLFLPPGEHIALAFSWENLRLTFTREPFLPPDFLVYIAYYRKFTQEQSVLPRDFLEYFGLYWIW